MLCVTIVSSIISPGAQLKARLNLFWKWSNSLLETNLLGTITTCQTLTSLAGPFLNFAEPKCQTKHFLKISSGVRLQLLIRSKALGTRMAKDPRSGMFFAANHPRFEIVNRAMWLVITTIVIKKTSV